MAVDTLSARPGHVIERDGCVTLADFANAHVNTLYDVLALLDAAAERIDAAVPLGGCRAMADSWHATCRLVQMAGERVKQVTELLADET